MKKLKILFICVQNSARSQMAEAFLKTLAGDKFEVESAGFEPGILNPLVVEAMKEEGIDISSNKTKSVFELYKEGRTYSFVITLCNQAEGEKCPIFPGMVTKVNWSFPDPSKLEGSNAEKIVRVREIRDSIKNKINQFIEIMNIES
jgi:arsenate reductase